MTPNNAKQTHTLEVELRLSTRKGVGAATVKGGDKLAGGERKDSEESFWNSARVLLDHFVL